MQAGHASGIRLTIRELSGRGCWGRMRRRISRCTGIGRWLRVFWSRLGEAFTRRDSEVSAKFLAAMRRFRRRGVLRRLGAWRKFFGFGSFWRASRTNRSRWLFVRKNCGVVEAGGRFREAHLGFCGGPGGGPGEIL